MPSNDDKSQDQVSIGRLMFDQVTAMSYAALAGKMFEGKGDEKPTLSTIMKLASNTDEVKFMGYVHRGRRLIEAAAKVARDAGAPFNEDPAEYEATLLTIRNQLMKRYPDIPLVPDFLMQRFLKGQFNHLLIALIEDHDTKIDDENIGFEISRVWYRLYKTGGIKAVEDHIKSFQVMLLKSAEGNEQLMGIYNDKLVAERKATLRWIYWGIAVVSWLFIMLFTLVAILDQAMRHDTTMMEILRKDWTSYVWTVLPLVALLAWFALKSVLEIIAGIYSFVKNNVSLKQLFYGTIALSALLVSISAVIHVTT